ncbi:type I-C CRISPR-associated protein Cas8c/Csd1 [Paenibacillaceae bacterium WGS1546]|uniref:type I-C CRISPR-associated protein Cas8c/Csd1 n=1 Tax=Cohnella sp. WGS1546 TaxID=3366810 RepID=UPI00372D67B1
MATREQKFGRILAIANVLGEKVFPEDQQSIATKYLSKMDRHPATVFVQMHKELMAHMHRFGAGEHVLMDMLGEQIAELTVEEMNNKPLDGQWLINYYHKSHELNNIMDVHEAGAMWGLSPAYVRNLCAAGTVEAKKIGRDWAISKNHPNPKKGGEEQ